MITHLLKIIWNQRKSNFLIFLEIFVSFLVLFSVTTLFTYIFVNYAKPLGFSYENVWRIWTNINSTTKEWTESETALMNQMMNYLKGNPGIQEIGMGYPNPYELSQMTDTFVFENKRVRAEIIKANYDYHNVFDIKIAEGRWFDASDGMAAIKPVIINNIFADGLFGSSDPLDKIIQSDAAFRADSTVRDTRFRVIGVIEQYRKDGEFAGDEPIIFMMGNGLDAPYPPPFFVVKVKNGLPAEFEEEMMKSLESIGKGLTIKIDRMENVRHASLKYKASTLLGLSFVGLFLLLMVGLGLLGVVWLNVSRRKKEIGLRRAKGANNRHIYMQISGELIITTAAGIILGGAVVMQFLFLDILTFISVKVFIASAIISAGIILGLTFLCAAYPSYMAVKIHPAEALRAE